MKLVFSILLSLLIAISSFGQFTDTAQLNQFIRDTIKDRRPDKVTASQIQKSLHGITYFLNPGLEQILNNGSSLAQDRTIELANSSLTFKGYAPSSFNSVSLIASTASGGGQVLVVPAGPYLRYTDSATSLGKVISMQNNITGIRVADEIDSKGLYYSGNYSSVGSSDPRWIPDVGYLNSVFSSAWKYTGNAATNPVNHFIGTTDAQPLLFRTNNTEKLRIESAGNIGIGNSAPKAKLHVENTLLGIAGPTSTIPPGTSLLLQGNSVESQFNALTIISGKTVAASIYFGDSDKSDVGAIQYHHPSNALRFFTNGAERVAIGSTGNVGIGVTTPTAKLHVNGGGSFSDTVAITTLENADSSNRAASTAFVKRVLNELSASPVIRLVGTESTGNSAEITLKDTDNDTSRIRLIKYAFGGALGHYTDNSYSEVMLTPYNATLSIYDPNTGKGKQIIASRNYTPGDPEQHGIKIFDNIDTSGMWYYFDSFVNGYANHGDRHIPDVGSIKKIISDSLNSSALDLQRMLNHGSSGIVPDEIFIQAGDPFANSSLKINKDYTILENHDETGGGNLYLYPDEAILGWNSNQIRLSNPLRIQANIGGPMERTVAIDNNREYFITNSSTVAVANAGFRIRPDFKLQDTAYKNNANRDSVLSTDASGNFELTTREGYKVYTALLSQSSTGAPVATVLRNTIGNVVWSYSDVGEYTATLAGAFTANKTAIIIGGENVHGSVNARHNDVNTIVIETNDGFQGSGESLTPSDSKLEGRTIEIRVYP